MKRELCISWVMKWQHQIWEMRFSSGRLRARYQFSSEMSRFLFSDVGLETINCESHRDEPNRCTSAFIHIPGPCHVHCLNLKKLSMKCEKSIWITASPSQNMLRTHIGDESSFFTNLMGISSITQNYSNLL